tara:strand:- start:185 stop:619 length:435 start_codon:yes stop_codon:yes gene_type:complete
MSKKIRILPDQYICKQGDAASTAFLVITGSFAVEIDNKKVGSIGEGEIFGELSLILSEPRKASIKAIIPSEVVEIKKNALEAILLSSDIELHKAVKEISKELGKTSNHQLPVTRKKLMELVQNQPDVIRALALQLHHRLSEMIF